MFQAPTPEQLKDASEWGQKIVEVYMTWYTFFVTANVAIMGWFFGRESHHHDPKPLIAISALFMFLNVLGCATTLLVASTVGEVVPAGFKTLIRFAGYANGAALAGNVVVWGFLLRTLRLKKVETSSGHR